MRCTMLLLLLVAIIGGCQQKTVEPEPVVHTPLDLDPTQDIQLAEWWTNGRKMVRLQSDGRYSQYKSMNRYDVPEQRGRWSRGSYAVVWLEPYATQQQRIRVGISRVRDDIVLNVPKLGVMHAMDQPPRVLEDQLVGTWEGTLGTLRLDRSMRFEFDRNWSDSSSPVSPVPSQGTWRLLDRQLELRPDSPAYSPVWLNVDVSADGVQLDSELGQFRKPAVGWMTSETDANPG